MREEIDTSEWSAEGQIAYASLRVWGDMKRAALIIGLVVLLCLLALVGRALPADLPTPTPYTLTTHWGIPVLIVPAEVLGGAKGDWCLVPVTDYWTVTPGKPKPPGPVVPPLTGLAADVRDWAANVESATRAQEAKALAAAYRQVAADIASTRLQTLGDVQKAQTEANKKALDTANKPELRALWLPVITKIAEAVIAKGLKTETDPAKPMEAISLDIAKGLEAVR